MQHFPDFYSFSVPPQLQVDNTMFDSSFTVAQLGCRPGACPGDASDFGHSAVALSGIFGYWRPGGGPSTQGHERAQVVINDDRRR
jgi:hypothetical protein